VGGQKALKIRKLQLRLRKPRNIERGAPGAIESEAFLRSRLNQRATSKSSTHPIFKGHF